MFKVNNESSGLYNGGGGLVAKSHLTLCDPMDRQAPLSMGFSRQEHWSGSPFPSPSLMYSGKLFDGLQQMLISVF